MATYGGGGAAAAAGAAEQVANHAPSKRSKGVFWSKIAKKDGGPGANATTPRVNSCILSVLCRHPMSRELSLCSAVLTCRSFIVSISCSSVRFLACPPSRDRDGITGIAKEDAAVLEEFFEVAIHHLLYVRNVYPPCTSHLQKNPVNICLIVSSVCSTFRTLSLLHR